MTPAQNAHGPPPEPPGRPHAYYPAAPTPFSNRDPFRMPQGASPEQFMGSTHGNYPAEYPYDFHPSQAMMPLQQRPPYPVGPSDGRPMYPPNTSDYFPRREPPRPPYGVDSPYSQAYRAPEQPPVPIKVYQTPQHQPTAEPSIQERGPPPPAKYQNPSGSPPAEQLPRAQPFSSSGFRGEPDSRPDTAQAPSTTRPGSSESVEDKTVFASVSWMCYVCLKSFSTKTPRIHCLECEDYDLCAICYQQEQFSDPHAIDHRIRSSIATRDIPLSSSTFADSVNSKF